MKYTDPTGHRECNDYDGMGCDKGKPGQYDFRIYENDPIEKGNKADEESQDQGNKKDLPATTTGTSIGPNPNFVPMTKLKHGLKVVSITFQAGGVGPWGIVQSLDIVEDASGKVWLYNTYAPSGYMGVMDGSMSPQVSASYQTGSISGLENVGDYMGYAKVNGGGLGPVTLEKVKSDGGQAVGAYQGGEIGLPIGGVWQYTTYSKPILEVWPRPGWIR